MPPRAGRSLRLPERAAATRWADGLTVVDADVLVEYDHPHFGRWRGGDHPPHGAGRVTYVGTVPDPALAAAITEWAVAQGSGSPSWQPQADTQSVASSVNGRGETVHVIHNWSWEPSTYAVPVAAEDLFEGTALAADAVLELGPWDVRVVVVA